MNVMRGILLTMLLAAVGEARTPPVPSVNVTSTPPGAEIFVNGRSTGQITPAVVVHGGGMKIVAVHWATRARGEATVTPGTQSVALTLVAQKEIRETPGAAFAVPGSFLTVETVPPGGNVQVDDKHVGVAPLKRHPMPQGERHIRISDANGVVAREIHRTLQPRDELVVREFLVVNDGQPTWFCPRNAGAQVRNPDGLKAFVNDKPLSATMDVKPGSHQIRVDGGASQRIELTGCQQHTVSAPPRVQMPAGPYCPPGSDGAIRVASGDDRAIVVGGRKLTAGVVSPFSAGVHPATVDGVARGTFSIEPCQVLAFPPPSEARVIPASP